MKNDGSEGDDYECIILNLNDLLLSAVGQEIGNEKEVGVVFSAGIDSTVIAFLAKKFCNVFTYTVGKEQSDDIIFAQKFEEYCKINDLNINVNRFIISKKPSESEIKTIVEILKEKNIVPTKLNLSLAVPIYFASKKAKEDKIKVMLSGQGSDEIFGGYARYLRMPSDERSDAMKRDIENAYKDNLNRDAAMCAFNKIALKFPYLNKNFLNYATDIPTKFKIYEMKDGCGSEETKANNDLSKFSETIDLFEGKKFIRKFILRKLAEKIGVPEFIVKRKKKAMQYGSKTSTFFR